MYTEIKFYKLSYQKSFSCGFLLDSLYFICINSVIRFFFVCRHSLWHKDFIYIYLQGRYVCLQYICIVSTIYIYVQCTYTYKLCIKVKYIIIYIPTVLYVPHKKYKYLQILLESFIQFKKKVSLFWFEGCLTF